MAVDSESAKWMVAWTVKRYARTVFAPKDRLHAEGLAKQIADELRGSN